MKCSYDVTAESGGAPGRLWSLLLDARSWPRWGPVDSLVLEQSPLLTNYQAEVLLRETPSGGSAIRWRGTYEVVFGLHFVMRPTMNRTMRRMVTGLARAGDGDPD